MRASHYVGMSHSRGWGVLPSNVLLGMCRWMGLHLHGLTDYNGVAFSGIFNGVTKMGLKFLGTLRWRKSSAQKWLRWGYIWPQTKTEIDYNGVGILRCQWHIPSKNRPKWPPGVPLWILNKVRNSLKPSDATYPNNNYQRARSHGKAHDIIVLYTVTEKLHYRLSVTFGRFATW